MTRLEGKKVLVVDDEPDLREIIREELEFAGCVVSEAESGESALDLVRKERFHAIVSDIRMAHGTGIELLDAVRKEFGPEIVITLITGFADITHEEAFAKGANAIFTKPFPISDLIENLKLNLTPTSDRLSRKYDRHEATLSFNLKMSNLANTAKGKTINIGRGGMFICTEQAFPKVGELVHFEIDFDSSQSSPFVGAGLCRWIREAASDGMPAGFGIEFRNLDAKSLQFLEDLLAKNPMVANIPRG